MRGSGPWTGEEGSSTWTREGGPQPLDWGGGGLAPGPVRAGPSPWTGDDGAQTLDRGGRAPAPEPGRMGPSTYTGEEGAQHLTGDSADPSQLKQSTPGEAPSHMVAPRPHLPPVPGVSTLPTVCHPTH